MAVGDDAPAEVAAAEVEPAGVETAWLEQPAAPRSATVAAPSAHTANLVRMTLMFQTLSQIGVRWRTVDDAIGAAPGAVIA